MSAGHDDVRLVPARGFGKDVEGLARLGRELDLDSYGGSRGAREIRTGGERYKDCRDREAGGITDHADQAGASRLTFVHDDHRAGAGRLRGQDLDVESARPALYK